MTIHSQGPGASPPQLLAVEVSCPEVEKGPYAEKGPYRAAVTLETTVGAVLLQAMKHFGVDNEEVVIFVLTRDGHREPEDRTIGQVAGAEKGTIQFQLT
jgi:hypothetical protein